VKFDDKQIFTNERLQTSAKHIYAAGDVTAHFQFTHQSRLPRRRNDKGQTDED
jgi:pyruvate/2-oxoglutarate dehydrogenase complex dihydrolipoamide dehydrogenase (E3) component